MHFVIFSYAKYFYYALLLLASTFITVLLIGCFITFPIEMGGGGVRWLRVRTYLGDRDKRTCAYDRGRRGGQSLVI